MKHYQGTLNDVRVLCFGHFLKYLYMLVMAFGKKMNQSMTQFKGKNNCLPHNSHLSESLLRRGYIWFLLWFFSLLFFFMILYFSLIFDISLWYLNDAMTHSWCYVQLMTHSNYILHCSSRCDDWYDDSFMFWYLNDDSFSRLVIFMRIYPILNFVMGYFWVNWWVILRKFLPQLKK